LAAFVSLFLAANGFFVC